MNKLTSLESNVAEYNPDVIGITESWATEKDIQGTVGARRLYMLQTRQNERLQH